MFMVEVRLQVPVYVGNSHMGCAEKVKLNFFQTSFSMSSIQCTLHFLNYRVPGRQVKTNKQTVQQNIKNVRSKEPLKE